MTAADAVVRVRQLIRDLRGGTYDSTHVISSLNEAIASVHNHLSNIQSNLVYAQETISLQDGVREYNMSGLVPDIEGVHISGSSSPLTRIHEHDLAVIGDDGTTKGRPTSYYLTETDSTGAAHIGFSPVPDAAYTVTIYYHPDPPVLQAADTTPLPYGGVWDHVIILMAAMDLREVMEGDISYLLARYQLAYSQAMQETFRRGVRPVHFRNWMFTAPGV